MAGIRRLARDSKITATLNLEPLNLESYAWRKCMVSRSYQSGILLIISAVFLLLLPACLWAQQKQPGPPPANVTVARVENGTVAPQAEFIATVFYQEISDTAAEISGLVEAVSFEEGQRVQAANRFWSNWIPNCFAKDARPQYPHMSRS